MNGQYFLNSFFNAIRDRGVVFLIACWTCGMTGCGVRTAPVTSTVKEVHKKDSTVNKSEIKKDSTVDRETVKEKTLPGSMVGVTLTKAGLDSLIQGLRAMPTSTERVYYKTDPKMQSTIGILLDSIGRVHLFCRTSEQKYYETTREHLRVATDAKETISRITAENDLLKEEIRQLKVPFWEQLKNGFNSWVVRLLILFIILGLIVVAYDVLKAKFFK